MRAYCRACPVATSAPAGVGLRTGSTRADGYSASAQGLLHAPAYSYVRHAATSGYGVVILVVPVAGLQSGTSLRRRTLCSSLSVAFCNGLWFLRAGSEGNNRRSRCRPARLWGYAGGYGGSASDAGRGVSRRIPANGIFACLQFWFRTPGGGYHTSDRQGSHRCLGRDFGTCILSHVRSVPGHVSLLHAGPKARTVIVRRLEIVSERRHAIARIHDHAGDSRP